MLSRPHTGACEDERARVQAHAGVGALAWHEKGGGHWRLTGSGLQVCICVCMYVCTCLNVYFPCVCALRCPFEACH
jgi:hypothetical protein